MPRKCQLTVLLAASLAVSGCAASIAASAVGAALRNAQSREGQNPPPDPEALKLSAAQACRAHASQFGTVHIIDLEQRTPSKIVVWGTATGSNRRSFSCTYTTKIDTFKFYTLKS